MYFDEFSLCSHVHTEQGGGAELPAILTRVPLVSGSVSLTCSAYCFNWMLFVAHIKCERKHANLFKMLWK